MSGITFEDFINLIKTYNSNEVEIITKAYEYAKELHKGQKRQSKEDYIIHPLNVAYILATMHADRDTICAGLLHDTLEDTNITKEDIAHEFNPEIASLVDGVTKISKMNFSNKEEQNLANTRKIITSITKDIRIVIIKLADRLHNMRTLEYKNEFKQKENSLETMQIFVPIAYSIGAYKIKSELEDLSFYYLNRDKYEEIKEKQRKIEKEYNELLNEMLYKIKRILENKDIPNEIKIRTKNIYSIYKKITEGSKLKDIHDIFALKIIVDEIDNCYKTLGIVHNCYHPINSRFKDYICNPKTNKYQSLHTTVFGPEDRLVQVQIRTKDMDKVAMHGLITYWDINKEEARIKMQEELSQKYQFFKSLIEINSAFGDNKDFIERIKREIFSEKVYIYNMEGNIIELPKGSTLIDYAYSIDNKTGDTLFSASVNGNNESPDYVLKNKDMVKLITDDMYFGNNEKWLDSVVTTKARERILEIKRSFM